MEIPEQRGPVVVGSLHQALPLGSLASGCSVGSLESLSSRPCGLLRLR